MQSKDSVVPSYSAEKQASWLENMQNRPFDRRQVLQIGGACASGLAMGSWGFPRQGASQETEIPPPENISLETKDRVVLRCTYYPGLNGKKTVPIIMIHDYLGRRTEYDSLARGLQKARGHAVIVPDLRGHGESTRFRGLNGDDVTLVPDKFPPAQFAAMVDFDLEKVKSFLMRKHNDGELNIEQLCVIAAGTMGSVVGLNWVAKDWSQPILPSLKQGQDVKAMVLLSPALNYKSLKTAAALKHPFVGYKLSTMLVGGARESDLKKMYTLLEKQHAPIPADEEDRIKHQDLFYIPLDTELKGTKLLNPKAGLGIDTRIMQVIDLRVVNKAEDFEWVDRTSPLGK